MSRDKLRRIIALLEAEFESPGPRSTEVIEKLREVATIYAARSGLRDARIRRALTLMSERLAEPWTVESLAKAVGMSRAAFARKFAAELGAAPLQHLHEQRMECAAALLAATDETLAAVAARVGYTSEFAFSRAFKRHHGVAPGTYRRHATTMRRAPALLLAA